MILILLHQPHSDKQLESCLRSEERGTANDELYNAGMQQLIEVLKDLSERDRLEAEMKKSNILKWCYSKRGTVHRTNS